MIAQGDGFRPEPQRRAVLVAGACRAREHRQRQCDVGCIGDTRTNGCGARRREFARDDFRKLRTTLVDGRFSRGIFARRCSLGRARGKYALEFGLIGFGDDPKGERQSTLMIDRTDDAGMGDEVAVPALRRRDKRLAFLIERLLGLPGRIILILAVIELGFERLDLGVEMSERFTLAARHRPARRVYALT